MQQIEGLIKKSWGYEILWAQNEKYCGKIIVFEKNGSRIPMHFHKEKDKSWFVNSGKFLLRYIDTKNARIIEKVLSEGETFQILPLVPHQIESMNANAMIFEVSTGISGEDFYQISPDNKKE